MKKISIIVPNFNNANFVMKCLNSIVSQKYKNKEIIVVDDGSTDDSVKIIRKMMGSNKDIEIKLICQNNLNAAMARNKGMEYATGDYVLFLDSDDLLEDDSLNMLIEKCEKYKGDFDLVVGGYEEIDGQGDVIGERAFANRDDIANSEKDFATLIDIDPVPSNKLYNLKLIRKNHLQWGNVRIGQDLNFYLKYLALCKHVLIVKENIYKYRIGNNNSMSNSYDFRIFDIVNVFDDVKNFYSRRGLTGLYKEYMPVLALKHYNSQMSKLISFDGYKIRKTIIDYFAINEKKIDYSVSKNKTKSSDKMRRKFRLKCFFGFVAASSFYRRYKLRKKEIGS
ncbi:glycosyltransferase family 2 protein [Candidatus Saccharibacteria bacterium]|nr:glycosyltransferase family 2 protein [Candidatus Saccharibacteria bacterium]